MNLRGNEANGFRERLSEIRAMSRTAARGSFGIWCYSDRSVDEPGHRTTRFRWTWRQDASGTAAGCEACSSRPRRCAVISIGGIGAA